LLGAKDTVGVHRGLSVVVLSNADTNDFVRRRVSAEIVDFAGGFTRRSNRRWLDSTECRSANNLRPAARVEGDAQFLVKNVVLKSGQVFGRYRQILAGF
jgi:hypothetical protein